MNRPNKGFTLMELLIVIGVLGILAAGLLAAIDPFEQLKKARDTNNRSAAIELLQSSQRFYANHGALPWDVSGSLCQASLGVAATFRPENEVASTAAYTAHFGGSNQSTGAQDCIEDLVADGELKSTFTQGLKTTLFVRSWNKTIVSVCFAPEGKSSRKDASTAYNTTTANRVSIGCTTTQRDNGDCVQCFQ